MTLKEKLWNKFGRANKTKASAAPPVVTHQAPVSRIIDTRHKASHRLSGFFGYSNKSSLSNLKKRQSYYGPVSDLPSTATLHVSPSLTALAIGSQKPKSSETDSDLYACSDADGLTAPTSQDQESLPSTHEGKTGGEEDEKDALSHKPSTKQDSVSGTSLSDSLAHRPPSTHTASQRSRASSIATDADSEDLSALVAQLRTELDKERATVSVLQRQKEAVTRDLDYLGDVVDQLTEDNDTLQRRFTEEESNCQSVKQDLDMMMNKLREATDYANTRSGDADKIRKELMDFQSAAHEEQTALRSQMQQKDQEIHQLKARLCQAEKQIKTLQKRTSRDDVSSPKSLTDSTPPTPTLVRSSIPGPISSCDPTISTLPRSLSPNQDELDDQLMKLTKEKERLQSSYSKIPISGGGRQSRRRKEELEEMLDEVDSQLSKVKQKIKRV